MRGLEIFWRFLALGCASFGGPTAHLGYFRERFVRELKWLSEQGYAETVALCALLPGPSSSQVGFSIGLHRGGLLGGVAAFLGFTLPSFLLMVGLALLDRGVTSSTWFGGAVAGLKLLAVAVVANAVLGLARQFWSGWWRLGVGLTAAAALVLAPSFLMQIVVLGLGAAFGLVWSRSVSTQRAAAEGASKEGAAAQGAGRAWLLAFVALAVLVPFAARFEPLAALFVDMVGVGSLVFGGGHVVLPLLQASVDGITNDEFLVGYAAAQGVPGPMFSLSSYLGAMALDARPWLGAVAATIGIFLPGFLLVLGLRGRWQKLARAPRLSGAFAGVNAVVVGLLLSAWIDPIVPSAIDGWPDVLAAGSAFALLRFAKIPVLWLIVVSVGYGLLKGAL